MKRIFVILMAIVTILYSNDSFSQGNEAKERRGARREKVEEKISEAMMKDIESGHFRVSVRNAISQRGRSVSLDGRYDIRVESDSLFSYLPFYGIAYSIPYGGGDGLTFDAKIDEYTIKKGKKNTINVKISVRTREDSFTYTVTFHPGGSVMIYVSSNNRQGMTYYGDYKKIEEKKE